MLKSKNTIYIYIVALLFIAQPAYSQNASVVSGGVREAPVPVFDTALLAPKAHPQSSLFRDTMSISRVTAISFVAPGFGQLYNGHYWKIPVLYASVGTFSYFSIKAGNKFRKQRVLYNALLDDPLATREDIDPVQTRMIQYNTQRTVFFMGALLSYIYFIGDGAVNYPNYATTVKKATTLSMIFPGAGQAYNRSYWKIPIVVGGFATMGYIVDFNSRGYTRFKTAANRVANGLPDEFNGRYTKDFLQNIRDQYRRNRDLSIILTGALYALNIIEAHVDAYLKDFDVSDDLSSVRVEPTMIDMSRFYSSTNSGLPGFGLALKINF